MSREKEADRLSHHILPTSANLLGICFVIFSLVHSQGREHSTVLDDCAAVSVGIFLLSAVLSYLSIRSPQYRRLERLADIVFLCGLGVMAATALLMTLKFVK